MDRSEIRIIFLLIFLSLTCNTYAQTFRFHVKKEPQLNPIYSTSGESNYIHSNLYRGLTRFSSEGLLEYDQAEKCRYIIDTDIKCKIKQNLKYHDGSPLAAKDFVQSFISYISPQSAPHVASLLFSIKNAKNYFLGKAKLEDVGIKLLNEHEIQFLLEEPDREFLDKLSSPLLVPFRPNKFNGPYFLDSAIKGSKWFLKKNEYYPQGNHKRPPIELVFVSEDSSAVNLYEKNKLDFLWRIPSDYISKFKNKPGFFQVPIARLDYIGFNQNKSKPFSDSTLREQFITHINFEEFKQMLSSRGPAGCPGLGAHFIKDTDKLCQKYNTSKVKLDLHQKLIFNFSQLGGDDISKQALWFKNQWKENLNVNVSLKSLEHKIFVKTLKENTPDIFRKGIMLQWPSCSAALTHFKSNAEENYTGFSDAKFDSMVSPFKTKKLSSYEKAVICAAAVKYLFLEKHIGIPLGLTHFSMIKNPKFKNIKINVLNQLDLSELDYAE